jgi:choline monooxygenase
MHSAATMSASHYSGDDAYVRERVSIFRRSWLFLAHESQLSKPGDVVALTIAGFPLLAVRDEKGEVRGFHNVCRHRAGPLAEEGESNCGARLTCRYHGWAYALDGRLALARDFGQANDFDPRGYGLFPLRCEIWRGMVFVNLNKDCEPLAKSVASLDAKLRNMELEGLRIAHRSSHDLKCNWKTYVENYLEGYHVPVVHPALDATMDAAHYEVDIAAPTVFHRSATREGAAVAGIWAWHWPCLAINVYAAGVLMERIVPVNPRETRIEYLFLAPKNISREEIEKSIGASLVTTREDIAICEAVQRNLDAGIYSEGRLSPKHEQAIAWFQSEVKKALD